MDPLHWYTTVPLSDAVHDEIRREHARRLENSQIGAAHERSLRNAPSDPVIQTMDRVVQSIAHTPVLLVACDFDGTISPLVDDYRAAAANPDAVHKLSVLSSLHHTHVAIVSGRGLHDLRRRLPDGVHVHLVGSHGAETEIPGPPLPIPDKAAGLATITGMLRAVADSVAGCELELKPRGVTFHYRKAFPHEAATAVARVLALAVDFPELRMRTGSMIVEFSVDQTGKGEALLALKQWLGATGILFIGDDATDEDAFAVLGKDDAGVKVGPGHTAALNRVETTHDVSELLARVTHARRVWLATRSISPIQSHGAISDERTIGLINPAGRLVWMCAPRIDSPSLFGELIDGPAAGFFEISPVEPQGRAEQKYDGASMVLQTRWPNCVLTDYLDAAHGRAFQRAGRNDLVRVVEGSVPVRVRFAPRIDFGRMPTRLALRDDAIEVEGGGDPIMLLSRGVRWTIMNDGPHQTAEAIVSPEHAPVVFELRYGTASTRAHTRPEPDRRSDNRQFWSGWAQSLSVPPRHADLVRRSALILRSLCHGPTGSIAAAGTTSLPEHAGGTRNWDYRFCWPRDASMAAAALVRLGNTGTAMRFLDWLLGVVDRCESPDRLKPIYTVTGNHLGPEAQIGELAGYCQSRPVRIGNAAAQQVQLDVFGPIVDLVALLAENGAPVAPDHWRLTRALVAAVELRWNEPDHGIWEIRGPKQHHVHSKAMCYATVDRALVVREHFVGDNHQPWISLRERIREDVLANGFSSKAGAFTACYGSDELDASSLAVGLTGLVPATDPRWAQTVEAVNRGLRRGYVVDRYRYNDGLPGREGGFHICTGWLIESLLSLGRTEEASALLTGFASLCGETGLFSEQYEPVYRMALGNVPQAYSHLAFINAAVALHRHLTSTQGSAT